jgi:hypothetical protein
MFVAQGFMGRILCSGFMKCPCSTAEVCMRELWCSWMLGVRVPMCQGGWVGIYGCVCV